MAELSLAIVPLCLAAIHGSSIIRARVPMLLRHDREMKRLRRKLQIQTGIFQDECQLLLQEIVDPVEAEAMILEARHPTWHSKDLDCRMKTHLGRKYPDICTVALDIKDHINSLDAGLEEKSHDAESPIIRTAARGHEAIGTFLHKTEYEGILSDLEDANQEFKRLRKAAIKIRKSQDMIHPPADSKPLPTLFDRVSMHSKSFYAALRRVWSCTQSQHIKHEVRLLLGSRDDDSLRVVMRYSTSETWEKRHGLIDLAVHSEIIRKLSIPTTMSSTSYGLGSNSLSPQKKKRRVHFSGHFQVPSSSIDGITKGDCVVEMQESSTTDHVTATTTTTTKKVTTSTLPKLCTGRDMCTQLCHQLETHSYPINSSNMSPPYPYLDHPGTNLRHQLIPVADPLDRIAPFSSPSPLSSSSSSSSSSSVSNNPLPLSHIFTLPVAQTLTVPQRLRLAASLVKGVLQFHSTPWLPDYWRLDDLAFFPPSPPTTPSDKDGEAKEEPESLADSLFRTLHITNELIPSDPNDAIMEENYSYSATSPHAPLSASCTSPSSISSSPIDPTLQRALFTHGIQSLSLYSLGAALLSIGYWGQAPPPEDVASLREAAAATKEERKSNKRGSTTTAIASTSPLGPQFQRAAERCLNCDFAAGSDLRDSVLRARVYWFVCRELEEMARGLEERMGEGRGEVRANGKEVIDCGIAGEDMMGGGYNVRSANKRKGEFW